MNKMNKDGCAFLVWFIAAVFILVAAITVPGFNWPVSAPHNWSSMGKVGLGFLIFFIGEVVWLILGLLAMWLLDRPRTQNKEREGTRVSN
jgi:hypothetical protein